MPVTQAEYSLGLDASIFLTIEMSWMATPRRATLPEPAPPPEPVLATLVLSTSEVSAPGPAAERRSVAAEGLLGRTGGVSTVRVGPQPTVITWPPARVSVRPAAIVVAGPVGPVPPLAPGAPDGPGGPEVRACPGDR